MGYVPYIGNITMNAKAQKHPNPVLDAKRQMLIRQYGQEGAKLDATKYIKELAGKNDIAKDIVFFFDTLDKPPRNITLDGLYNQYKHFENQYLWVQAMHKELHLKMQEIVPESYKKDMRKRRFNRYMQQIDRVESAKKIFDSSKEKILQNEGVKELVRQAIERGRKGRELKRHVKLKVQDMRVVGIRQIERGMTYLFAEYIVNPEQKVTLDPQKRYEIMIREADWLGVMAAEISSKLLQLADIIASAEKFMQKFENV
jgi:hypothetical protein